MCTHVWIDPGLLQVSCRLSLLLAVRGRWQARWLCARELDAARILKPR